jgi:hypothetical protein
MTWVLNFEPPIKQSRNNNCTLNAHTHSMQKVQIDLKSEDEVLFEKSVINQLHTLFCKGV